MDLSLEFPDRYHGHGAAVHSSRDSCALEGMINWLRVLLLCLNVDVSSITCCLSYFSD